MSWDACMRKKIVEYYGEMGADCVHGMGEGDLEKIAQCLVDAGMHTIAATVVIELGVLSAQCALEE